MGRLLTHIWIYEKLYRALHNARPNWNRWRIYGSECSRPSYHQFPPRENEESYYRFFRSHGSHRRCWRGSLCWILCAAYSMEVAVLLLVRVSLPLTNISYLTHSRAIVGAVLFTAFAFIVPGEPEPLDKTGKIDFVGSYFGVAGLILFNFVWKYKPDSLSTTHLSSVAYSTI